MTQRTDEPNTGGATRERILGLLDDPRALEALYRQDPAVFRASLEDAYRESSGSVVLEVWRARLESEQTGAPSAWRSRIVRAVVIVLAFGAVIRVPAFWLDPEWYYMRLAPLSVVLALCAYFWIDRRDRGRLIAGIVMAVAAAAYACLLPDATDSAELALIHLPLVFWAFLGFVFMGKRWRESDARIDFLRYNGELLVLASLVALGGMVFSGVTVALLQLISDRMGQWYIDNVAVFGFVAVPVAATLLYDTVFRVRTRIAAVLARVFAPLFLVMAVAYLIIALVSRQNPFLDRSFLITFNGLLLVVLGITVVSIAERDEEPTRRPADSINLGLVAVTLLIDVVALAAIVFRLASFGLTPNRVAVLGANLVTAAHLAWLLVTYLRFFRRRPSVVDLRGVVAGYLPVYGMWAAVVVFVLPAVFKFA